MGRLVALTLCSWTLSAAADVSVTGLNGLSTPGFPATLFQASIDGVPSNIIIDHIADIAFVGEAWKANVYEVSSLGTVRNTQLSGATAQQQLELYEEAAWLATNLVSSKSLANSTALMIAMWGVFDPFALLLGEPAAAIWLAQAQHLYATGALSPNQFGNVSIYAPTAAAPTCFGIRCSGVEPPELIVVRAPEAPSLFAIAADALGFLAIAFFLLRKPSQP